MALMKWKWVKRALQVVGCLFLALLAVAVVLYCTITGPRDLDKYPPAAESPYRLPWTAGQTYLCVQSNRAVVSHRGWDDFAYDFAMPVGTEVRAARGGEVVKVVVEHDGHGYHWPNNMVLVRHDDGTIGWYVHIKKDGSRVAVGDRVTQGQVVALSGHVGNSTLPHLHFQVTDGERKSTLRLTFADVAKDRGIPRMFKWYTAGGAAPEASGK